MELVNALMAGFFSDKSLAALIGAGVATAIFWIKNAKENNLLRHNLYDTNVSLAADNVDLLLQTMGSIQKVKSQVGLYQERTLDLIQFEEFLDQQLRDAECMFTESNAMHALLYSQTKPGNLASLRATNKKLKNMYKRYSIGLRQATDSQSSIIKILAERNSLLEARNSLQAEHDRLTTQTESLETKVAELKK
ncbi:hypothetical protein [Pseudomonas sp. LP_7_YM]|uniref:hypothetical protein n=1 Tax=Pseudomonas sp. LP_7_YM TaxID=2485137 RepID=UPI00105F3CA4|nr:hypothetical protein [Pseudomonas sp. LP_7_YM]TDV60109.1 hypothetical protein EC915_11374 [Pseudomonas sp. LP_7_YM]